MLKNGIAKWKHPCGGLVLLAALVSFAAGLAAQEKEKPDKRDEQAKDFAEKFMKALAKAEDFDAIKDKVDVPFFMAAERIAGKNLKDREEVQKNLGLPAPPSKQVYTALAVYSFGALPEKFFNEHEHKLLKETLTKTDRIVVLRARRLMAVAVRFKGDEAKVVGIRNHLSPLSLAIASQEKDQGDKRAIQARKVAQDTVQQFLKAAKAKDLDSLVKLNDVPWYSDGEEILKDRQKLNDFLKRIWIDRASSAQFPSDVLGLIKIGEFGDPFGGERLPATDVVTKDDWLVFVGQNGIARGFMLVRMRDGVAKVVGAGQ